MTRQKARKLILIISMLLFPVTIYYFSPAFIIMAGLEGVINGSFIVFVLLLLTAIIFGRLFCSYLCPGGAIQECLFAVNNKTLKHSWKHKIKYVIWTAWIAGVIICYIFGAGIHDVDFLYQTEYGISIASAGAYIIYYGIILLFVLPALIGGRRAFCHYFCWMAPFMIIGIKLRKLLHLPGIRIVAEYESCISCKKCNQSCPMSIDVETLIKQGEIRDIECIQCGACKDACPQKILSYSFRKDRS